MMKESMIRKLINTKKRFWQAMMEFQPNKFRKLAVRVNPIEPRELGKLEVVVSRFANNDMRGATASENKVKSRN